MRRRSILAGIAMLAAARPALAAASVRFGWLKGTNDLTLAKAHGALEKAFAPRGIGVEWAGPFPASAPAVEALNAGAIDITVGTSGSMAASLAAGAPVVAFNYQRMGNAAEAIIIRADAPFRAIGDLAGKRVACNRGGSGEYLLVRALLKAGMQLDSVQRVYLGPGDAGPAFAQGHVDAWAIWDPFLTLALAQYGARVLEDGAAIGSDNAILMLASRDFVAHRQADLRLVFDVLAAENAWSLQHPAAAGAIWAQALALPEALGPALGRNNAVPTLAVGPMQQAQLKRVADWYVQNGIVPAVPGIDQAVIDLAASGKTPGLK